MIVVIAVIVVIIVIVVIVVIIVIVVIVVQGSLKVVISVYPYLEKTPNFSRFYKKTGSIL